MTRMQSARPQKKKRTVVTPKNLGQPARQQTIKEGQMNKAHDFDAKTALPLDAICVACEFVEATCDDVGEMKMGQGDMKFPHKYKKM